MPKQMAYIPIICVANPNLNPEPKTAKPQGICKAQLEFPTVPRTRSSSFWGLQGLGSKVQGLGFRIWGLGLRV